MPRPKTKAADYKRMTLRLPPDMFETLQQQADVLGRTMNTHIIYVLRDGLETGKARKVRAPTPS